MKAKRINPPYRRGNPSKAIFRSLSLLKIPGGSRDSLFCHANFNFLTWTAKTLYHPLRRRVVILFPLKLGTILKNILRWITLVIRSIDHGAARRMACLPIKATHLLAPYLIFASEDLTCSSWVVWWSWWWWQLYLKLKSSYLSKSALLIGETK